MEDQYQIKKDKFISFILENGWKDIGSGLYEKGEYKLEIQPGLLRVTVSYNTGPIFKFKLDQYELSPIYQFLKSETSKWGDLDCCNNVPNIVF